MARRRRRNGLRDEERHADFRLRAIKSLSFTVTTLNTPAADGQRTVTLSLGVPSGGATVGPNATATLTIQDNDAPGTFQFGAATYSVVEGGTSPVIITRTGGSGGTVVLQWAATGGSATGGALPTTPGADYAPTVRPADLRARRDEPAGAADHRQRHGRRGSGDRRAGDHGDRQLQCGCGGDRCAVLHDAHHSGQRHRRNRRVHDRRRQRCRERRRRQGDADGEADQPQ